MRLPILFCSVLCMGANAQGPTAPTNCVVSDLTTLLSIEQCPAGVSCHHASVLAHVNGAGLPVPPAPPFSFVTGLTMPTTGREFAIIGASNGLLIVDTHDLAATPPGTAAPTPWMWFEPEDSGLQGACTYNTDHRGVVAHGSLVVESNVWRPYLRVFEISGTSPPFTVTRKANLTTTTTPLAVPNASYRLSVDREQELLFVPACPTLPGPVLALKVFDLRNIPPFGSPSPTPIWVWTGGGPVGPSVTMNTFDAHLYRDGAARRLAVSEYTGPGDRITVLDVSNLVRSAGGTFPSPYAPLAWAMFQPTGTHSVWVDPTAQRMYNSFSDSLVQVYDLAAFPYNANGIVGAPPLVNNTYRTPATSLLYGVYHVAEGIGATGYAAGWTGGLKVLDLRPDALTETQSLATVDTCLSANCGAPSCIGSTHHGVWSVFRNQDSGVLYLSDQARGLFLVRSEVAHVHRYGRGVGTGSHPTIPSVSLESGAPRVPRAATGPSGPYTAIPALDATFDVTVANLDVGAGTRIGVLDISLLGDVNSPLSFDSTGVFQRFGTLSLPPIFFAVTGSSVVVPVPLAGSWEGLPVFLQVAVFDQVAGQFVATSRGSFVGVAAQRN